MWQSFHTNNSWYIASWTFIYVIHCELVLNIPFYMVFIYTKFQGNWVRISCFLTNFEKCEKRIQYKAPEPPGFIIYILIYLFIKALQHKCWRSAGHQVLQSAGHQVLQSGKDVKLGQYVWKVADRRKENPWCTRTASNLQPSDLRERLQSLPGDQDIFSLAFFMYLYPP